jgi:hypothetical protein
MALDDDICVLLYHCNIIHLRYSYLNEIVVSDDRENYLPTNMGILNIAKVRILKSSTERFSFFDFPSCYDCYEE